MSDVNEILVNVCESIEPNMTISEVNDAVRHVMLLMPDIDSFEFYVGDDDCIEVDIPAYSDVPEIVYDIADKLCAVGDIADYVRRRGRFVSSHKGTIPYLVGFVREVLGFYGIRKVFVFGIGEKMSVTFGPTVNGKPNPEGELVVAKFLTRYITKFPNLPYHDLDSWNEKRKGISFGISVQR